MEQHEIIHALREWAREHGRAPRILEWDAASDSHHTPKTVFKRFGSWQSALRAARLPAADRSLLSGHRTDAQMIHDLQRWATRHRHPPRIADWTQTANDHPHAQAVIKRFGSWNKALVAAGLPSPIMIRKAGKFARATWHATDA